MKEKGQELTGLKKYEALIEENNRRAQAWIDRFHEGITRDHQEDLNKIEFKETLSLIPDEMDESSD
jgi:hypothetical protein